MNYGYEIMAFWSAGMLNPPFNKTIYTSLNNFSFDRSPGKDIGDWDRYTTKKAIEFLTSRKQKKPFFLHLF